jgi:hypothetical protein
MAPPHAEEEVLKPLDPALIPEKFENEWPEFQLKNTVVRDADGELVSLLAANAENLLTITGELKCRKKGKRLRLWRLVLTKRRREISASGIHVQVSRPHDTAQSRPRWAVRVWG